MKLYLKLVLLVAVLVLAFRSKGEANGASMTERGTRIEAELEGFVERFKTEVLGKGVGRRDEVVAALNGLLGLVRVRVRAGAFTPGQYRSLLAKFERALEDYRIFAMMADFATEPPALKYAATLKHILERAALEFSL
ncbi:MAG: hypothetical protein M1549_04065 [Candidatus Dependentiae bacterium]|nr:hypothetical protein [Candidatus Dependentiae bacterium]